MITVVSVASLTIPENLYPRTKVDSETVNRLVDAIRAGSVLPPIVADEKTLRISDGAHRLHAYKKLEIPEVEVELINYTDDVELWLDALSRNSTHGRPLSSLEIRRAILRARDLHIPKATMETIVNVPVAKLENIYKVNLAENGKLVRLDFPRAVTDNGEMALKYGLRYLHGSRLSMEQVKEHERYGGMNPTFYVRQIIGILEQNMWPKDNEAFCEAMDKLTRLWEEVRASAAT